MVLNIAKRVSQVNGSIEYFLHLLKQTGRANPARLFFCATCVPVYSRGIDPFRQASRMGSGQMLHWISPMWALRRYSMHNLD